ncbi:hypothetical protein GCM10011492_00830 [Flexivirga endophytica]|uniref:Camelysin metallo-endopeptidase n=1 Tax=Flexivirga endophytica TaxID=1849103 RepID=A0A916SRU9_9MICO|nr:hypothetical protein [Flexivirga endophytica]GGB14988.1 hypothetical protein GCM10011492_00830 [Flexivirga endophytica]GHB65257.1 hypothetical protein GCM10008112_37660 [Flexivirga endophytica]
MSSSTTTRRRNARLLTAGAIVAGLAASAAIVWQASYSAFSAQTSNPSSNWTAGTVALSDDDTSSAMFNATGLKPGSTGTKCIAVTSTGSLASAVKLYGTTPSTTNALASSINLTIAQGTGGGFGSCTGFTALASGATVYSGTLDTFGKTATNYATGLGTWAPTGSASDTRVYQITYTLDPAAPNSVQGGTASIGLTWEAQNS